MKMGTEERLAQVKKKEEQLKQREMLAENRARESKKKLDNRRLFIIGEMFCKHFPIALEITPGRSSEEDHLNFEYLDNFIEALAKCQQCYQEVEDTLLEKM